MCVSFSHFFELNAMFFLCLLYIYRAFFVTLRLLYLYMVTDEKPYITIAICIFFFLFIIFCNINFFVYNYFFLS